MFCAKCGSPLSNANAKFCGSCGAPVGAPASAAPPAASSPGASSGAPAAAAKQKSSPWIKLIVIVLAFFLVLGIGVAGVITYLAYRVKQKIVEAKTEYGLDKLEKLGDKTSGSSSPVQARDVCSLLSKQEVSEVTGVTITEASGDTSRCTYASATNDKVVEDSVTWEGGAMAFKMTLGSMKMVGGGQGVVKVPGIGDEAVAISPGDSTMRDFKKEAKTDPTGMLKGMTNVLGQAPLMFRKGDVYASVGVSEAPDLDEAKKELARKIASRL